MVQIGPAELTALMSEQKRRRGETLEAGGRNDIVADRTMHMYCCALCYCDAPATAVCERNADRTPTTRAREKIKEFKKFGGAPEISRASPHILNLFLSPYVR